MKLSYLIFLLIVLNISLNEAYYTTKTPRGALLEVKFKGKIGYNLDEIPSYALDSTKDYIKNNVTKEQWETRVRLQIYATIYRQVYLMAYFEQQLTIPPTQVWRIHFEDEPFEETIQGHSYISRCYSYYSVAVGKEDTLNAPGGPLNEIGGEWSDIYLLPVDPEHLFQRIGYACANEASYSLDTVNSENILGYYDQRCNVEPFIPIENRTFFQNQNDCHWTFFPNVSCIQALEAKVGYYNLTINWKRIRWDHKIADEYRYGEQTSEFADLINSREKLIDHTNIVYKYFDENSCTLREGGTGKPGCIEAVGWRHLLRFQATEINVGKTDLAVGSPFSNEYISRGVFEFDPCHVHYHYQHFQSYALEGSNLIGRKTGFCLESTNRYHNNEFVPFNTPFGFCSYQGISPGWGDDYFSGLDCQWIDVTGLASGNYNLSTHINPDNMICEGNPILDSNQNLTWIKTDFTAVYSNITVYKEACDFTPGYNKNNKDQIMVHVGLKSLVTMVCNRHATISPRKDCGFKLEYDNLVCNPGLLTQLAVINVDKTNAVVRICESSKVLGISTQCEYVNMLANTIIKGGEENEAIINFICPSARSSTEPGGLYSILVSTILPKDKIPRLLINF